MNPAELHRHPVRRAMSQPRVRFRRRDWDPPKKRMAFAAFVFLSLGFVGFGILLALLLFT